MAKIDLNQFLGKVEPDSQAAVAQATTPVAPGEESELVPTTKLDLTQFVLNKDFNDKTFKQLAKELPGATLTDIKDLVVNFFTALGEGAEIAIDTATNSPGFIESVRQLKNEAEKRDTTALKLIVDEGLKPIASALIEGLKQEFIAPGIKEGLAPPDFDLEKMTIEEKIRLALSATGEIAKREFEFLAKRGLAKPATSLLDVITLRSLFKLKSGKDLTATDKKVVSQAKGAGLSDAEISSLKNLTPEQQAKALETLEQAKKAAGERVTPAGEAALTPLAEAGVELQGFQKELSNLVKGIGKEIGAEAKKTKGKSVGLKRELGDFTIALDDANVKIKGKTIDFTDSDFAGTDQKLIQEVFDFMKKPNVDQRDMLSKIRNIGGQIFRTDAGITTSAQRVLGNVRKALSNKLVAQGGKFGELNKKFSLLKDIQIKLNKAIDRKGITGVQAPEFIKQAFGSAGSFQKKILSDVQKIAKQFKIKQGQNILKKGDIAITTEKVAGVVGPTSQKGIQIGALASKKGATLALLDRILAAGQKKLGVITPTQAAKGVITGIPKPSKFLGVAKPTIKGAGVTAATIQAFGKTKPAPIKKPFRFAPFISKFITKTQQK